jgi:hypothetical protein
VSADPSQVSWQAQRGRSDAPQVRGTSSVGEPSNQTSPDTPVPARLTPAGLVVNPDSTEQGRLSPGFGWAPAHSKA